MRHVILAFACSAAPLLACSPGGSEDTQSLHQIEATRTFPGDQFSALPLYTLRETLRISGDSVPSGYELMTPMGIVSSSDGRIYVLDGGSFELIAFDSTGSLIGRFGGRGQGPGEFSAPLALALASDTIFVLDRLLHAFSLDGEPYYSMVADTQPTLITPSHFVHAQGNLVLVRMLRSSGSSRQREMHVDTMVVHTRSPSTGTFTTRFALAGDTFYVRGRGSYFHRLLGAVPHMAVTRSGKILFADGADYHIDVLSLDGEIEERIIGEVAPEPIHKDQFEALLDRAEASSRAHVKSNPQAEDHSKVWRQLPRAHFKPMIGRLIPGDGRLVLVERTDVAPLGDNPARSTWDIVDLDNGPVGVVSMDSGFVPLWFTRGQIYGLDHSEMGSAMVLRYALEATQ